MKIFGLKNCDKCRLALKKLSGSGVNVSLVDVRSDGISVERLEGFYKKFGSELVNKRSTTWRNLPEDEKTQDIIPLLVKHPALMKRPIINSNDKIELGWNKDVERRLLS